MLDTPPLDVTRTEERQCLGTKLARSRSPTLELHSPLMRALCCFGRQEEIDRRRNLMRRVVLWSLGPILLALAAFILGLAAIGTKDRGLIPNGLPFLALVVAWIFGYFVMREREFRELKHEIDELNDLERDNRR